MKKLIITILTAMTLTACSSIPAQAEEKRCTGLNDSSFKCAAWLGSDTFLDLASSADTAKLAADGCIETVKGQISPNAEGQETFNDGVNKVTVTVKDRILTCVGSGL
jgi:hypothetical protein